ncbi:MAG TPA: hypothetical protein VF808_00025 [Ktedonobacterales bacterium]
MPQHYNIPCRIRITSSLWQLRADLMAAFGLTNEDFQPPWWPDGQDARISGVGSVPDRPWYPAWLTPAGDRKATEEDLGP